MKRVLMLIIMSSLTTIIPAGIHAQGILNKIRDKAKQRTDAKVDKAIDKSLDQIENNTKDTKVKVDDEGDIKVKTEETKVKIKGDDPAGTELAYTSKYDFIQGEKIIAQEDYNDAAIGDFPTRWN